MPKGVYVRTEQHRLARLGRRHSDETKRKISEQSRLRAPIKHSIESRRNMSKGRIGMKFSKSHIANMSKVRIKHEGETNFEVSLF